MIRKILNFSRSLRLTIVLIICLTALFLLGLLIPQKALLGKEQYLLWKAQKPSVVTFLEFMGFTEIYTSPAVIALWALFFINLTAVMVQRTSVIWRICRKTDIPVSAAAIRKSGHYAAVPADPDAAVRALHEKKYEVFREGEAFHAVKNRFSPLATLLFHLSFFVILIGGIVSFYTRFRAEASVAVGESFNGQYELAKLPKIGEMPDTVFTVESIQPVYYRKSLPVDLRVTIVSRRGRQEIGINTPYKEGPAFFVIKNIDIAPLFVIKDKEGREIDGAYVKLKGLAGETDSFFMAGYKFFAVFHTDYLSQGVEEQKFDLPQSLKQSPVETGGSQQKEIVNPAFRLSVYRDGKHIGEKLLAKGDAFVLEDKTLIFSDLTYWVRFLVIKEYGVTAVYAGFVIMVIALMIRFLMFRRDIRGFFESGTVHVSGRAEFYPSLFDDEFNGLLKNIRS